MGRRRLVVVATLSMRCYWRSRTTTLPIKRCSTNPNHARSLWKVFLIQIPMLKQSMDHDAARLVACFECRQVPR